VDAPIVGWGGREAKLGDDVTNVGFDRVVRDVKAFRDAAVGESLGHQREDFALSRGEPAERVVLTFAAERS
jgi:hypothetical protein